MGIFGSKGSGDNEPMSPFDGPGIDVVIEGPAPLGGIGLGDLLGRITGPAMNPMWGSRKMKAGFCPAFDHFVVVDNESGLISRYEVTRELLDDVRTNLVPVFSEHEEASQEARANDFAITLDHVLSIADQLLGRAGELTDDEFDSIVNSSPEGDARVLAAHQAVVDALAELKTRHVDVSGEMMKEAGFAN